jgi:hypothetical protein
MSVKRVVGLGFLIGIVGVGGQIPLLRMGLLASGSLRGMLSIFLALAIGFITGNFVEKESVKAAALAGFIAGTMFAVVGIGALLSDPSIVGQRPLDSPAAFFVFVSSLISSTVVVAWIIAGIAAVVALPLGLAKAMEQAQ